MYYANFAYWVRERSQEQQAAKEIEVSSLRDKVDLLKKELETVRRKKESREFPPPTEKKPVALVTRMSNTC